MQDISKLWRLVTDSSIRRNCLLLLDQTCLETHELKEKLGITHSSSISREIRKLVESGLVEEITINKGERYSKSYKLTGLGDIITNGLKPFSKTIELVNKDQKFWREHRTACLPEPLLEKLYQLNEGDIVRSTPMEVDKPMKVFIKNLMDSNEIFGISPIFRSEFPPLFSKLAESGITISLILTEEVIQTVQKNHWEEMKGYIEGDTEIYVCQENIGFAATVSDTFLSLGLFDKEGNYDHRSDLVCKSSEGIQWGRDLFEYVKNQSELIEMPFEQG